MSSSLRGVPSGLASVPGQLAAKSDYVADQLCQLADRQISAGTDVDDLGAVVILEQEKTGRGKVVDMEKFAPRFARAPDDNLARAAEIFASCALRRRAARTCDVSRSKLSFGP